jgi:hypothetical protein
MTTSAQPNAEAQEGKPSESLLNSIRIENLNVYRASSQRLREDVGQESQIAQDYRGRLVYELLQNADDAMAVGTGSACIRFELTDTALWVANSGRALDEADIRGLCGISASKKSVQQGQKRRASIGHKGMGFKSVLEITDAPEVFSTNICFRFSPNDALLAVRPLVIEGTLEHVSRAPATRFPWPANPEDAEWARLRQLGMNTAFRFPLRDKMTGEQRDRLATVLRELPITSLVFLKHIGRVEVEIERSTEKRSFAWSVHRQQAVDNGWRDVSGFAESGDYRVTLQPDNGLIETFVLAYDVDIAIADHRGGLDEFSWEGVEYTEISVAARMRDQEPAAIIDEWKRIHVFLPTGEPCPYDLLVSGAFGSNLSRQEIRVEEDSTNYNRFMFRQAARVLRERLLPKLIDGGATVVGCLRLLDRHVNPRSRCATAAAQALYEEVVGALADLPFLPMADDDVLSIRDCAVPPLVSDEDVGRAFRKLLYSDASCREKRLPREDLCGASISRVLVDHGAYVIAATEAASLLAGADPAKSALGVHVSGKIFVDPVLSVLEQLWQGLNWEAKPQLIDAVRSERLFPVAIEGDTAKRISTQDTTCFYPPRFLHGEVPLAGLCFLLQELCWGDLTPKERNAELQYQMEAWKALFDIREFKFPEVMRASVLPALDLERDAEEKSDRAILQDLDRLAAICQLAGRTPNANAPLPYERLGPNRALFNLSRLDVPCRGKSDSEVKWTPAYKAYFGSDWIGPSSVECILDAGRDTGVSDLPDVDFVLSPDRFVGLLEQYRDLKADEEEDQKGDVGEDEVSVDEDEDAALDADDRERWLRFFQWLGVNASLRAVHFHDVEDRASGWLKTGDLRRPEGWAFQNIPIEIWNRFSQSVREHLAESDLVRAADTSPYFYDLHDLEHLVAFANISSTEPSARFARALYEHLARNWTGLEKFSRVKVAQVSAGQEPARRTKPPRAKDEELADGGLNLWLFRLQRAAFCPTVHGPRISAQTWLPTAEVQRRFGRRNKAGSYLIPALDVDAAVLKGKARAFAQALGVREELSPTTFTVSDARVLLERLCHLYQAKCDANQDLRPELREVIRPAYRNLMELLSGKSDDSNVRSVLGTAMVLATNGHGALGFFEAKKVFYLDRRDTRERLVTEAPIWTFVIEASPGARVVLTQIFGMRILEDSLDWAPKPGDAALDEEGIGKFRGGLRRLAPYLLARVGADRADERLARQDARSLRDFIDHVEPVTSLDLGCSLDEKAILVSEGSRDAFVNLDGIDTAKAFVVWGENPWPPSQQEAETLAGALCDVLGAGYFESFIALLQSESKSLRERILRRAGAPLDVDEKWALFQSVGDNDDELTDVGSEEADTEEPRSAVPLIGEMEEPAANPTGPDNAGGVSADRARVPLYESSDLLIDGTPITIAGTLVGNGQFDPKKAVSGKPNNGSAGSSGRFGGNTDLVELDALGMWVALSFERGRLRRAGLPEAEIFDAENSDTLEHALVFDVSKPDSVEIARSKSPRFFAAMTWLHQNFGIVPDWPGFDILTLDPREPNHVSRMIELKSSGVASRVQEMTWNEWKTAKSSILRERFYLYLVGNLRSDLAAAQPYIRTIRNPFEQIASDVQVSRITQRKVQLTVTEFREAEHLDLTVQRTVNSAENG